MESFASVPPTDRAVRRLNDFLSQSWKPAQLVEFHTRHKLELFSHHVAHYRALGRLVAQAGSDSPDELARRYRALFLDTLAVPQTRQRHVDTVSHALGHLRGHVDSGTRHGLSELIENYRGGATELNDVRWRLYAYAREHEISYLLRQTYFDFSTL